MKDARLRYIIATLEPPAGKGLWYGGVSIIGSLKGVKVEQALWKPATERHSIWELMLHIAYWKYAVRNKLVDGNPGGFDRSPVNWPVIPSGASNKDWEMDKQLLKNEHKLLVEAVKNFDGRLMDEMVPRSSKWTYADILMGTVTHDIYHTGQIMLMKRLYKEANMGVINY